MVLRVYAFQALARNVGVDGGGRNIGMTQQHFAPRANRRRG